MTMHITFPRWVLPASLLLNVFCAGVIVALALPMLSGPPHRPPHGPHEPRDPLAMAEHMAETLPAADAAILRAAFAHHTDALRAAHRQMDSFPDRVRDALDAEPFRIDALAAVFADGRAARVAMEEAISGAILDAAATMSPEGRHRLAAWRPGGSGKSRPPAPDGPPPPGAPPPR
jgi:Predicted integral membrane protein